MFSCTQPSCNDRLTPLSLLLSPESIDLLLSSPPSNLSSFLRFFFPQQPASDISSSFLPSETKLSSFPVLRAEPLLHIFHPSFQSSETRGAAELTLRGRREKGGDSTDTSFFGVLEMLW